MAHISEYDVENLFIDRLESIGYEFVDMSNYDDVVANFRKQLAAFNAPKLVEAKGEAAFSDAEFGRVMIHVDNHSVYESAKILRDKYVLTLDNGRTVYLDFFSSDTDRNIYQVTHQVTMDKDHKDDVSYKNRYDVTILINGLPLVQIELKRPGVEINEAINQINRYRKFSFKGLFRYLQLFVVSNSVQTKYFCNENEMDGGVYNPILKSLVFFWTDENNKRINKLDEFTAEFLRRSTITEMLDKYMVIKTTEPVLMVMRPYQIFAVKAAKRRVLESNQNGYVFACTGSGKTLTSFKLAQLLRDEPRVDKVIFLIDRKDLDDQTVDEYNSFEKDCVDGSDSTADVFYAGSKLDACLHRYMIKDAIADGNVLRFSVEYQRTIFAKQVAANGIDPERLGDPDYCRRHNLDLDALYHDDERIRVIAKDIFEHHEQHVHPQGKDIYTALFAVDSIKTLGKYYDAFKELNEARPEAERYRVAAIFTYQANEDMDEGGDEHSQELLGRCMDDYNAMFGTSFSLDSFDAYRKDITRRMKQKDLPQVDILLVVNMMLTGFDAKPLNTLYLDKNLIWHTLVQAYSRTNRVDKVTKQFGQIVSYRDIKRAQDDALRLFSGDGDPNEYLLESYEYYVNKWVNQVPVLRKAAQTVDDAGQLQSEGDIRQFVVAFRSLSGTLATLKTFGKFDWADLSVVLDDEEYEGYKSWYLYYHDEAKKRDPKVPVPVDVDFDVELVRTDRINVMYILSLLKSAHDAEKSDEERARDIDLVMREIERSDNDALRAKKDIMEAFIRTRFYELPEDADIQQAYEQFERESLQAEIESFAYDNGLDAKDVLEVFSEYTFGGSISEEAIRRRLAAYRMGLLKITKMTGAIKEFVVNTYSRYKAEGE